MKFVTQKVPEKVLGILQTGTFFAHYLYPTGHRRSLRLLLSSRTNL